MTSAMLLKQLREAFGLDSEADVSAFIGGLRAAGQTDVAEGLGRLLAAVGQSYSELEKYVGAAREADWLKRAFQI
ncbi:MAG: hypothetical protein WBP72_10200, partial [Rhodocyclaceae bacterium]